MRRVSLLFYLLISLVIVLADQVSKYLIVSNFTENKPVPIIGDLLYFRFIYNEGGAMGTSLGPSWLYTILTIIALFLIVRYFASSRTDGVFTKVSLALILGGAVGNLIDRLIYGKVVDFIDMDFPDIPFLHIYRWFTFNIADAAITVGLVLFGLSIIFRRSGRKDAASSLPGPDAREVPGDAPQA